MRFNTDAEVDAFLSEHGNPQTSRDRAMADFASTTEDAIDAMDDAEVEAFLDMAVGLGVLTEHDFAAADLDPDVHVFDLTDPEQAREFTEFLNHPDTVDLHNPEDRARHLQYCAEMGIDPNSTPRFDVTGVDLSNVDETAAMTEDALLKRWQNEV